ncbi:hypothetical protein PM082_000007 [Marasmius tenuissimus]|nr:hypothetical protein PM082_000007 [Marasmius tenuissimus]
MQTLGGGAWSREDAWESGDGWISGGIHHNVLYSSDFSACQFMLVDIAKDRGSYQVKLRRGLMSAMACSAVSKA